MSGSDRGIAALRAALARAGVKGAINRVWSVEPGTTLSSLGYWLTAADGTRHHLGLTLDESLKAIPTLTPSAPAAQPAAPPAPPAKREKLFANRRRNAAAI